MDEIQVESDIPGAVINITYSTKIINNTLSASQEMPPMAAKTSTI